MDVHRRQENANAYLKLLRANDNKRRRVKYVEQSDFRQFGTTEDVADMQIESHTNVIDTDYTAPQDIDTTGGFEEKAISDFLAKAVKIDDFSINSSNNDPREYDLAKYLHGDIGFRPSGVNEHPTDMWAYKLKGYSGLKGTFVLRVQVNAQQFQAGRLIMYHEPMKSEMRCTDNSYSGFDRSHKTTFTQLPRVELDFSQSSEMVMEIPYRSLNNFYNLINRRGSWGTVTFRQYLPMRVGSTTDDMVDVSVWLSLKDIKFGPPAHPITYTEQMGDVEKQPGPIEKVMGLTAEVSHLAENIPYIGKVAKKVTWAANIAKNFCGSLGFSKPLDTEKYTRVISTSCSYMNNCNGVDPSANMGLFADNAVEDVVGFGGSTVDEASLAYIKTRSAYFKTVHWESKSPSGTQLATFAIRPSYFFNEKDDIIYDTPISGLSRLFETWRGSLIFKFKLVKTVYHKGRFSVVFSPSTYTIKSGMPTKGSTPNIVESNYVQKTVYDIGDQLEFEFSVPFNKDYAFVDRLQTIGTLTMFVENTLVAPDTVSKTIDFIVEVRGAEDLQYAIPRQLEYIPVSEFQYDPTGIDSSIFHKIVTGRVRAFVYDGNGKYKIDEGHLYSLSEEEGPIIDGITSKSRFTVLNHRLDDLNDLKSLSEYKTIKGSVKDDGITYKYLLYDVGFDNYIIQTYANNVISYDPTVREVGSLYQENGKLWLVTKNGVVEYDPDKGDETIDGANKEVDVDEPGKKVIHNVSGGTIIVNVYPHDDSNSDSESEVPTEHSEHTDTVKPIVKPPEHLREKAYIIFNIVEGRKEEMLYFPMYDPKDWYNHSPKDTILINTRKESFTYKEYVYGKYGSIAKFYGTPPSSFEGEVDKNGKVFYDIVYRLEEPERFVLHSEEVTYTETSDFSGIGASSTPKPMDTLAARQCMGEQILSLKQLALRKHSLNKPNNYSEERFDRIPPRPFAIYTYRKVSYGSGYMDMYSYVASLFAFVRGGVNLYVEGKGKKTLSLGYDTSPASGSTNIQGCSSMTEYGDVLMSYIPQYSYTMGRLVTAVTKQELGTKVPFHCGVTISLEAEEGLYNVYRTAADDTQYGFFTGFPPTKKYSR